MTSLSDALRINPYHAIAEAQVEVRASPVITWAAFTDMGQWHRWVPGLEEARWIDQPEWGVGSHFYVIQDAGYPLGRTISTFTISAVTPERAVQWVGPMGRVSQMSWWEFAETDAGTRVTARQLYHGNWIRLYRWVLFERRMQALLDATLAGLQNFVERAGQ